MSEIEGRGLESLEHSTGDSPRLRTPAHHSSVRVGIASRRAWISFAGVLLLVSAVIGFYTSAQLFNQAAQSARPNGVVENAEVAGVVTETDGDVIEGATVTIIENGTVTATNADGWYSFGEIPPGSYTIEASKPGYQTVSKQVVIESAFPRLIGFTLEPGSGRVEIPPEETPSFLNPAAGALALAVAVLFASGMAAMGGISALRHRHYLIAVTGAAAGVLTLGYFIGSIAAIAALAILASLRHGFREAEYHHLPWEEEPAEQPPMEPAVASPGGSKEVSDGRKPEPPHPLTASPPDEPAPPDGDKEKPL